MRFTAKALAVILSLLAGSSSFAQCGDNYVADCGIFSVLNTVCKTFDNKGQPTGGTETFAALFDDPQLGKVALSPTVYNDVAIYRTEITSGVYVVVNFSSKLLASMKRQAIYSTHTIQNGLAGEERNCKEFK